MLGDPLGNYGFGNREQLSHRGIERLKLFRRTGHVVSMIALFVLSCSCALAAQSSQPAKQVQSGRSQQSPAGQQQSNPTPPINLTVTTPEKSATEKEEERKRAERQDATNQRIAEANDRIAALTFWLVIVGAMEATGTILAFIVGILAANAAKKSAQVAERTLVDTQRAFVHVDKFITAQLRNTAGLLIGFRFAAEWRNVGPTPGRVRTKSEIHILQPNEEPPWDEAPNYKAPITMAHGAPMYTWIGQISMEQANALKTDALKVILVARASYETVFQQIQPRHTDMVVLIQPTGASYVAEQDVSKMFLFVPHGPHNDAN